MKTKDNVWFNHNMDSIGKEHGIVDAASQVPARFRDELVHWHNDAVDAGLDCWIEACVTEYEERTKYVLTACVEGESVGNSYGFYVEKVEAAV